MLLFWLDATTNLEQMRQKQEIIRMVLAELTPVNDLSDIDALREYLQGLNTKQTVSLNLLLNLSGVTKFSKLCNRCLKKK